MFLSNRSWLAMALALSVTAPAFAHDSPQYLAPENKIAGQLMLFEQGDISSSMHAIKHELEYLSKEFEPGKHIRSQRETLELIDRAKSFGSTVEVEVAVLWDRFSQLNRRRWKTKTNFVYRDLFSRRDIAAFDDRVAKLKADRVEIFNLRDNLSRTLLEAEGDQGLVKLFIKQMFPTAETGASVDHSVESSRQSFIQITDESLPKHDDQRIATGSGTHSGSDFETSDLIPTYRPDSAVPVELNLATESSSASRAPSESVECGRYSGPYCGKSLSEVIEMKRLENDF